MQLIRKWNPQDALYIDNPNGPKVYRILALIKDGVHDHYVCFYDSWTGKVYIEKAIMKLGSSYFDHHSLFQIETKKEWMSVIDFLRTDECQVIQMVESTMEKDSDTGELKVHDAMHCLPRTKYGVDSNGKQSITGASPIDIQMSPSLLDEQGRPIIDFTDYKSDD